MSKLFYRFRSIDSLLGLQELEKQTIYFASPEELNDSMEGFRDLVFIGDKIVWKNLFKHYLMCLEHVSQILILAGEKHHKINLDSIPIFKDYDSFPTNIYKKHFLEIAEKFLDICDKLIDKISRRTTPIRKDELSIYLDTVHHLAITIIQQSFEDKNIIPKSELSLDNNSNTLDATINIIDMLEKTLKEKNGELSVNALIEIQKSMNDNILFSKNIEDKFILNSPNRNFVLVDFVENYINSLEKLMYPDWYTACFMSECTNSSVWGHYGNNHKGVCLVYEPTTMGDVSLLDLNDRAFTFLPINYNDGFDEVDFFKSIGRMTINQLETVWYYDEKNNKSKIADDVLDNQDSWRETHLKNFYRDMSTKSKDWEYEKEYRLLYTNSLKDNITQEDKLFTYNFKNLKGLIFGIKTSIEDKIKIVDIIKLKCKEENRKDFEFNQAYYSNREKNIQHRKIGFLKFQDDMTRGKDIK